jgi:hypothetical protein
MAASGRTAVRLPKRRRKALHIRNDENLWSFWGYVTPLSLTYPLVFRLLQISKNAPATSSAQRWPIPVNIQGVGHFAFGEHPGG